MKYKVGDIVKLRDDLEEGKYYGDYYCSYKMAQFRGEKVTIAGISEGRTHYSIEEDCRLHYWTDEMIEGLWEESCQQVKKDDKQAITGDKDTTQQVTGKLKLIDVLNKIANGELKEGTKVKLLHDNTIYKLDCDELVREGDYKEIFELYCLEVLAEEVELIKPEEPTECEHEWEEYGMYNTKTKEDKHFRKCIKCDLEEEIEPSGDTTEKIEELNIDFANEIILCNHFQILATNKLNEVIRKINKED